MRIGIFGGSGLIGRLLVERLKVENRVVVFDLLPVQISGVDFVRVDVLAASQSPTKLAGCQAVINLCGQPIFGWPPAKFQDKYLSRVATTKRIVGWLEQMPTKPAVFIGANAVGYYGDHGEELIAESSPAGSGELAKLCLDWQAATQAAEKFGIRTVVMRQGVVISPTGGVMAVIKPFFKLGLGATFGNRQGWFSWIGWQDLAAAYELAINNSTISGPVNLVSPEPVRQKEFIAALAKHWRRPAIWRWPKFFGRLIFGSAVEEITASRRVLPTKLLELGFQFRQAKLITALRPD